MVQIINIGAPVNNSGAPKAPAGVWIDNGAPSYSGDVTNEHVHITPFISSVDIDATRLAMVQTGQTSSGYYRWGLYNEDGTSRLATTDIGFDFGQNVILENDLDTTAYIKANTLYWAYVQNSTGSNNVISRISTSAGREFGYSQFIRHPVFRAHDDPDGAFYATRHNPNADVAIPASISDRLGLANFQAQTNDQALWFALADWT